MKLIELRSDEADFGAAAPVALLPLGAVEQHSRHLPLGTDSLIVEAVAEGVEARMPKKVLLMPTIRVGASDHHLAMPGSVSVGSRAIADAAARHVLSLADSTGLTRFVLLNGHGGNQPAVRLAIETIHAHAPGIHVFGFDYWSAMFDRLDADSVGRPGAMGHADHIETSILLAVRPDLVRLELAVADGYADRLPAFVATSAGIPDRTAHGGVGDPRGATRAHGEQYLAAAVQGTADLIELIIELPENPIHVRREQSAQGSAPPSAPDTPTRGSFR